MSTLAARIQSFYRSLTPPDGLPEGVEVLDPYSTPEVRRAMNAFIERCYRVEGPRVMMLGINPGRFGAGITGIPFTDPRALREDHGIEHSLGDGTELSARFVHAIIAAMGGPDPFYQQVYVTALSPYGFVRNGKNLNYYDDPTLERSLQPFIDATLREQVAWGMRSTAIILGTGKNADRARRVNDRLGLFDDLLALPHPRYVMQYKRRQLDDHIRGYLDAIRNCVAP